MKGPDFDQDVDKNDHAGPTPPRTRRSEEQIFAAWFPSSQHLLHLNNKHLPTLITFRSVVGFSTGWSTYIARCILWSEKHRQAHCAFHA
jgi:hypothetical protein